MTIFGYASSSYIETSYIHGVTPAAHGWMYQGIPAGMSHISIVFDWGGGSYSNQNVTLSNGVTPGINQYDLKRERYAIVIINNGQGTHGYTVNTGNHGTPDKVLYSAEIESGQYYWIFNVGSGGYGGVTWDHRGVSTPVMNYHSIKIDQYSIANILHNGNPHPSQIETYYNHGDTPGHALRYNGMYPQEGCRILIDGSGSDSSTIYQAYNGTTPDTIGYYINTSLVIINNGTGIVANCGFGTEYDLYSKMQTRHNRKYI